MVSTTGGRWQVSQVHLAHDVAHAPLEPEQLDRYVSRSRKQSVFEAARADLTALYRGLDAAHPVDAFLDTGFDGGLDWDTLYGGDDDLFDTLDPFGGDDDRSIHPEEPVPAEDRAMMLHRFGRRVSGVTWSPGGAVSFVAYDKVLEGRLRGKSHMEPIWQSNGWAGTAPVTRHEARLRREALRALGVPESQLAEIDDPWQMLEHQQDLFGYVVGRPATLGTAIDCPPEVDVVWLRWVVPQARETNRSRWPTDPTWAAVQAASFTDAPVEARRLIRRAVRSDRVEQRDRGSYGLLVSRTALAFTNPKHWNLDFAMTHLYKAFTQEDQKPGKVFHELVRRRRRELGLSVSPEERVLPFRSHPSGSLPALNIAFDQEPETPKLARTTSLQRTEWRLEELDVALEEAQRRGVPLTTRHNLEVAFEKELQTYQTHTDLLASEDS